MVQFINMTQITDEVVVWKICPEFPFIEANQFGEIRTIDRFVTGKDGKKCHYKGHILKQYQNQSAH